jgi:protein-tyrosine phosphatase
MSQSLQLLMMQRCEGLVEDSCWDAGLVVPGLYVGSLSAALDIDNLRHHGINRVLTFANHLKISLPSDIDHLKVDIIDQPQSDLLRELPVAFQFIDTGINKRSSSMEDRESKSEYMKSTLVHCASGVSRSVALCCAWLMCRRGLRFKDALDMIRRHRSVANPNIGFKAQLSILEEADVNLDVESARSTYIQRYRGDITNIIRKQRESANELHAGVDKVEKDYDTQAAAPERNSLLIDRLVLLKAAGDDMQWELCDTVAQSIKKSGMLKLDRLLSQLQGDSR